MHSVAFIRVTEAWISLNGCICSRLCAIQLEKSSVDIGKGEGQQFLYDLGNFIFITQGPSVAAVRRGLPQDGKSVDLEVVEQLRAVICIR